MKIGIDFGTCFSKIAVLDDGEPTTKYIDNTVEGIPSLFLYDSGHGRYGEECLTIAAYRNSGEIVRYMKDKLMNNVNLMNGEEKIRSGGEEFDIKDIVRSYLEYLVNKAKVDAKRCKYGGKIDIEEVTISSPVRSANGSCLYHIFLKESMMDITGLPEEKVHVINEPEAAAIAYLNDVKNKNETKNKDVASMSGQTLFVFDLGGGTLDTTIIQKGMNNNWVVRAISGDSNLGGKDWDDALYEKLVGGRSTEGYNDYLLRQQIIDIKKELSTFETVKILPFYNNLNKDDLFEKTPTITRKEFEECSKELLNRARDIVYDTLSQFEGDKNDIDRVIVVGGASNMPQISNMLNDIFGTKVYQYEEPLFAVCLGDAIQNGIDESISAYSYSLRSKDSEGNDILWTFIYKGDPFDKSGKIQKNAETAPYNEKMEFANYRIYESVMTRGSIDDHAKYDDVKAKYPAEKICGLDVDVPIKKNKHGNFKCDMQLTLFRDGIVELLIKQDGKEIGRKKVGGE